MTKHLIRRDDYFYNPYMQSVYVNYQPPTNSDDELKMVVENPYDSAGYSSET